MTRPLTVLTATGEVAAAGLLWWTIWTALLVGTATLVGGHVTLVTSGSMQPTLRPGDLLLASRTVDHPVEPGAVVTFVGDDGRLVSHRVVSVDDDGYVTQGDANRDADRTRVAPSSVVSHGRGLLPVAGAPALWWQQRQWWALFGWAALLGGALWVSTRTPVGAR